MRAQGNPVEQVSFPEVLPIWRELLWPGRRSPIKPLSPVNEELRYDPEIERSSPSFWGIREGEKSWLAVLSGYRTSPSLYRVRGLYVAEEARTRGYSRLLFAAAAAQARAEGCAELWSLPRQSAWPAYAAFGFERVSEWFEEGMEFGPNCLAKCALSRS